MTTVRTHVFVASLLLALLLGMPFSALFSAVRAQDATPVAADSGDAPVLLLAAPGMRPDLVEAFAAEGALPAMASMVDSGETIDGGLVGPFPATTATSFPTLLTGTWPGEHGVVGDRFFRTGSPDFADFANAINPGLIQADTLPQAVERAGKTVVAVGWEGLSGLDPALDGPVVGGPVALSRASVVANYDLPERADNGERLGVDYDRVDPRPAEGWSDAPESFSPARETDLTLSSLDAEGANPDREFAVYIYDSTDDATENYDHVLVAPEKDAAAAIADLVVGAWASAPLTLAGDLEGQAAGFWLKAIDLAPDLSRFRLYATAVSRIDASWAGCMDRPECAAPGGFAEAVNLAVGAPIGVDTASLEAGLIDEATFVAQGITSAWQTVDALRFIVEDLDVQPDLLLLATPFPEAVSQQFLGLLADRGGDGAVATPVMSDAEGDGVVAVDDAALLGFVRDGYTMADEILAAGRDLLGPEATTLMVSTGGLAPSWRGVNAGQVLVDAGIAEKAQLENCVPGAATAPP
ncbi:MAG: alkaline phosphatase family protein, partial [Chloroflexia bacterium]|nr:alkaline phosphatase family protein [Chloroflexia bacterium]